MDRDEENLRFKEMIAKLHDTDTCSLAICVPSGSHWLGHFGASLFNLPMYLAMNPLPLPRYKRCRVQLIHDQSSIIHTLRHQLVTKALKWGATHVLFVDSDQTFPPDVVHRLMKWDKLVVGANIVTKEIPAQPCARVRLPDGTLERVWTGENDHGLQEVEICGTGLVLIDTRLFAQIEMPFFSFPYIPERKEYIGEDAHFCFQCKAAGVPVYIDHDVSRDVGHLGTFNYTLKVAGRHVAPGDKVLV